MTSLPDWTEYTGMSSSYTQKYLWYLYSCSILLSLHSLIPDLILFTHNAPFREDAQNPEQLDIAGESTPVLHNRQVLPVDLDEKRLEGQFLRGYETGIIELHV
jgi:hypothetical protein